MNPMIPQSSHFDNQIVRKNHQNIGYSHLSKNQFQHCSPRQLLPNLFQLSCCHHLFQSQQKNVLLYPISERLYLNLLLAYMFQSKYLFKPQNTCKEDQTFVWSVKLALGSFQSPSLSKDSCEESLLGSPKYVKMNFMAGFSLSVKFSFCFATLILGENQIIFSFYLICHRSLSS